MRASALFSVEVRVKTRYEYIHFVRANREPGKKTDVWQIRNNKSEFTLGYIKWHGQWRQYCVFTKISCIFNKGCLADIQEFLDAAMDEWRKERAERKD